MGSKLIRVSEKTYEWLNQHGKVTNTFDEVIQRLIRFYEERGGEPLKKRGEQA